MGNLENHKCKRMCHTVSDEERKQLFDNYWALGDFNSQQAFVCGTVKQITPKRRYGRDPNNSRKTFSRVFYVTIPDRGSVIVCKSFFLQVFGISNGFVDRCMKKVINNDGVPSPDGRGKHTPSNKLSTSDIDYMKMHISSFPRHVSHYSREHQAERQYLSSDLNLVKMYKLYEEKCKIDGRKPLKEWAYRNTFNTQFNLSFHPPRSDTCKKCDILKAQIDVETDETKKKLLNVEKELHLRKAEKARKSLNNDSLAAKIDDTLDVITFDLQKTLPVPYLTTNEVYYKRQLSVFNLGIHSTKTDTGHMYMWHEGIASRGPNEIGSCLLDYCRHVDKHGIHRLIAYSDSCGGQNRNYKMALRWMYIINTCENIEEIDHKLLVSGHSFLPNDQDFGLIEKAKKKTNQIYVPAQWQGIVRHAKRKQPIFNVRPMTSDDFFSTSILEKTTVNRKLNTDTEKVEWLKIQWMQFRKSDKVNMFYKYSCDTDAVFSKVDFSINRVKRGRARCVDMQRCSELQTLYPKGRKLKKAKIADLMSLLKYIPPVHHQFYYSLKDAQTVGSGCCEVDWISDQED